MKVVAYEINNRVHVCRPNEGARLANSRGIKNARTK
jgi:hypothetical protein